MRLCDRVDCAAPYEVLIGWIPAASRTGDDAVTVDRSWFYACRPHAREAFRRFDVIGAAPVFREKTPRQGAKR